MHPPLFLSCFPSLSFLSIRRHPCSTLFPYTTLFRSSEIVAAVRAAAAQENLPCVDFQRIVAERSRQRLGHAAAGSEMFLDHVHLTVEMTSVLAQALVEALAEAGIVKSAASAECLEEASQQINESLGPEQRGIGLRNIAKVYSWAGKMEEAGPAAMAALEFLPDD